MQDRMAGPSWHRFAAFLQVAPVRPETPRVAWKRYVIPTPVDDISPLFAVAIDTWWQERCEREAKFVLLERLCADFLQIRAACEVVEDEHRAARDACIS